MDWVLPLFTDGALQGSVLIPILIGILWATLFTETFGWPFSGIVVAGYLTPIVIIAPWSAAIIGLEAACTLGVARLVCDILPRTRWYAPLFGRDRFLIIIFLSVIVRLGLELAVLPWLGQGLALVWEEFDWRNRFTGIGLVVVPLLANMLWKPGLIRGLAMTSTCTLLTWLTLTVVLVPFTNFSLGHFYLIYETAALDFAASPTAYILLLIGAFLAAHLNLYFGWDFNGLMVPTLLAISLFTPAAFLLTFLEALLIWAGTSLAVRAPLLRNMSFEGPRLITLMYALGIGLKLLLEHAGLALGSLFGDAYLNAYGYLLSTLLAAKMWQKNESLRILTPVMLVALCIAGVGGALVVAAGSAEQLAQSRLPAVLVGELGSREPLRSRSNLRALLAQEDALTLQPGEHPPMRLHALEGEVLSALGAQLWAACRDQDRNVLNRLSLPAQRLGLELLHLEDPEFGAWMILHETPGTTRRGWGLLACRWGGKGRTLILAPFAGAEPALGAAALGLALRSDMHGILLPGAHPEASPDGASQPLHWPRLPLRLWLSAIAPPELIDLRLRQQPGGILWAERGLVSVLRLADWPELGVSLRLAPEPAPVDTILTRYARQARAQVWVDRATLWHLAAGNQAALPRLHGLHALQHALALSREESLEADTTQAQTLLITQRQLLAPLLASLQAPLNSPALARAAQSAQQLGWELVLVERDYGGSLLWLRDRSRQGRGSYLFRRGECQPIHVLAPQPISVPGSLDAALALFDDLDARAVSIGPMGIDQAGLRSADRLLRQREHSVYQLVHQAVQAESWKQTPCMSVELRGSERASPDMIVQEGRLIGGEPALSPAVAQLLDRLRRRGWSLSVQSSSDSELGLGGNRQFRWSESVFAGPYVGLWLSRSLRERLRLWNNNDPWRLAVSALGLMGEPCNIPEALGQRISLPNIPVPLALGEDALHCARSRDLRRLELLQQACQAAGVPLTLLDDRDSGAVVLLLGQGSSVMALHLSARDETTLRGSEVSTLIRFVREHPRIWRAEDTP